MSEKLTQKKEEPALKYDAGKPPFELLSRVIVDVFSAWELLGKCDEGELKRRMLEAIHTFADGANDTTLTLGIACAARLVSQESFYAAMERLADVLAFGASKYAADNWRKGMSWRRLIGAALRHAYQSFTRFPDAETKLPHLAHFMCDCMFLEEYRLRKAGVDDRWKATGGAAP